jgi:hypothetical protein
VNAMNNLEKRSKNMETNIYIKMQNARSMLQEMNLKKSGKNKFSGFSYYELADFIPAINKIFQDLKLYSIFSINNEREASLSVINAENPEEKVIFTSPTVDVELKGCTPIQGLGAVHTYMTRYLYLNALEIVENDALDSQAGNIQTNHTDEIDKIKTIDDLNASVQFQSYVLESQT